MPMLLSELTEGVQTLTLNQPDKLNALSAAMVNELIQAVRAAERDDAVRAVGAGDGEQGLAGVTGTRPDAGGRRAAGAWTGEDVGADQACRQSGARATAGARARARSQLSDDRVARPELRRRPGRVPRKALA